MEEAAQKDPTGLGSRIREARVEAGLTQEELAELIGVGTRQMQYYESGDSNPYRTLRRIAEATGKSIGWFMHGDAPIQLGVEELAERLEKLEASQVRVEEALAEQRSLLDALLLQARQPAAGRTTRHN